MNIIKSIQRRIRAAVISGVYYYESLKDTVRHFYSAEQPDIRSQFPVGYTEVFEVSRDQRPTRDALSPNPNLEKVFSHELGHAVNIPDSHPEVGSVTLMNPSYPKEISQAGKSPKDVDYYPLFTAEF